MSTNNLNTIDEVLNGSAVSFKEHSTWAKLDKLVLSIPENERVKEWNRIASEIEARNIPSGHPHFRLGILYLIDDPDETRGIQHLEIAYEQDQLFSVTKEPHRMAAYRVLGLIKDFFDDLRTKTKKNKWQEEQLHPPFRRVLITTLLALYDESTRHIFDAPLLTFQEFKRLFKNEDLRRFAAENYSCAYSLLEMVMVESGHSFLMTNEYPLSRVLVGLYGGVLEAILADRLSVRNHGTLGKMMNLAHDAGLLSPGTRLAALATVLLYFRNHIHPNKDIARDRYLVDINVARGLKVATDWVVDELLHLRKP